MLVELAVTDLGVIESARVPFSDGLVALTGETGAGKTMLLEALGLLTGAKADPSRVRRGAAEAVVEGLFAVGDDEWVLRRVVPAEGRSRAYVNGSLATAATLSEVADGLMELHGQHSQQQLFSPRTHRSALDEFAGIDTGHLEDLRDRVRALEAVIDAEGGDEAARLREVDLLRFQIEEIEAVGVRSGETVELEAEEAVLGDALAHREAAEGALAILGGDGGVSDQLASAVATIGDRSPLAEVHDRLRVVATELVDVVDELRRSGESIEPDPERLEWIQQRRSTLADLGRKYGPGEDEILAYLDEARTRLERLVTHDERLRVQLDELDRIRSRLREEAVEIGSRRRAAAPGLASAIEAHLGDLAMPEAEVAVVVRDGSIAEGDGASVEFLISTGPGMRPGPLAKVASGGELSRVMLALRLVLSQGPPTVVFDEVDAGIGGEAAIAVGAALAAVAEGRQVLVVTHLPQVAAFADMQIRLEKSTEQGSVATTASPLSFEERILEISRMLSGRPDSQSARRHAEDLLSQAVRSVERTAVSGTSRSGRRTRSGS